MFSKAVLFLFSPSLLPRIYGSEHIAGTCLQRSRVPGPGSKLQLRRLQRYPRKQASFIHVLWYIPLSITFSLFARIRSFWQIPQDEQLKVYLVGRVPYQLAGNGDNVRETLRTFFNQLDVHLEASNLDGTATGTTPPSSNPTSSTFSPSLHHRSLSTKLTSSTSSSSSAPNSPKMHHRRENSRGPFTATATTAPESLPFFSHTFNSQGNDAEPIFYEQDEEYCCLYPFIVPIRKSWYVNMSCMGLVTTGIKSLCQDSQYKSSVIYYMQYIVSTHAAKISNEERRRRKGGKRWKRRRFW